MRLINAKTLSLREFYGIDIPPYAILSHTWGDEEVTFKDWEDLARARKKAGFAKIQGACSKALEHGLDWVWVDTNCIDKSSSAELSEAINSMFDWYARSDICYAYLGDVTSADGDEDISRCRWFSRGWTLQELVAPRHVSFYAADWSKLGSRNASLADLIWRVTGIDKEFLDGTTAVQRACIAQKMSWLAKRTTTRTEDIAYCMLGLFEINMPLLYGEGSKAFTRLQHEIIRTSNDHTIFCWTWTASMPKGWTSLLAPSPSQFAGTDIRLEPSAAHEVSIYSMTNAGLSIWLPVLYTFESYFIVLQAAPKYRFLGYSMLSCIQVDGKRRGKALYVSRVPFPQRPLTIVAETIHHLKPEPLLVMNNRGREGEDVLISGRSGSVDYPGQFTVVIAFDSQELRNHWARQRAQSYPPEALDTFLSTVKLDFLDATSGRAVGAALVQMRPSRVMATVPHVYIFVAAELSKRDIRWFCQIFVLRTEGQLDHTKFSPPILEDLKDQVRNAKDEQPGHYSEALSVSVVVDDIQPLQNDRINSFLRISKGRARLLRPLFLHEGDSSGFESMGSDVAVAKLRDGKCPARGAFHIPGWE
jgi:hypothetical protein